MIYFNFRHGNIFRREGGSGKKAGIHGGSSHGGRRSFASNLPGKSTDVETLQPLLRHVEPDHVMPYLEVAPSRLREMFACVF